MAEDSASTDPLDDEDPEEDTPDDEPDDTDENTQQAQQPDVAQLQAQLAALEQQNKGLQAWNTREAQRARQLEDRILSGQQTQPQLDPSDPLAAARAQLERERQALQEERQKATIAASADRDMVEAWETLERGFALDPSPQGRFNALINAVTTLATRYGAQQEAQANQPAQAAQPKRSTRPRPDAARSDAPDPEAIDRKIAGAIERKDLQGTVTGLLDKRRDLFRFRG